MVAFSLMFLNLPSVIPLLPILVEIVLLTDPNQNDIISDFEG